MKSHNKLERKLIYRLIRVLYFLCLVCVFLYVGVVGWDLKPESRIDYTKSYLVCNNGKQYNLDSTGIYVSNRQSSLNNYEDKEAKVLCLTGKKSNYDYKGFIPDERNYKILYEDLVNGSWLNVFIWWGLGFLLGYSFLNIAKETLLYIIFGESFTWDWLKTLID